MGFREKLSLIWPMSLLGIKQKNEKEKIGLCLPTKKPTIHTNPHNLLTLFPNIIVKTCVTMSVISLSFY